MSFLHRSRSSLKKHAKHLRQIKKDLCKELKTAIQEFKNLLNK